MMRRLVDQSFLVSLSVAGALLVLSTATTARSQPNPFNDYEAMKAGQPPPRAEDTIAEEEPFFPFKKGSMMVGARTSLSYAGTTNHTESGAHSNSTFFFRLTPTFAYFVADHVMVGGSLGLLEKTLSRDSSDANSESAWLFEATVHYVFPVTRRFALAPGAGLGFYVGSSQIALKGVDEATSTRGLAAALYLNAGYQISTHVQVRSGLALFLLVGSETINSQDQNFSTSAAHIGLPVEIFYTF